MNIKPLFQLFILSLAVTNTYAQTLTIGCGQDLYQLSQPTVKLLEKTFKKLPYDLKWQVEPMARSITSADAGLIDGDYLRHPETAKHYDNLIQVPVSLSESQYWYITRRKNACPPQDALNTFPIAGLLGAMYFDDLTENYGYSVIAAKTVEGVMLMIKNGRAYASIIPVSLVADLEERFNIQLKTCGTAPVITRNHHLYLHKNHQDKLELITNTLRETLENN